MKLNSIYLFLTTLFCVIILAYAGISGRPEHTQSNTPPAPPLRMGHPPLPGVIAHINPPPPPPAAAAPAAAPPAPPQPPAGNQR
ncbi:uncharacterized protein LOC126835382 [Adelges cooleyi]|uniref:uncharacterized protein LOC126835382 n=1 Tax=Adelges cooleyi TaxID=133065 RepID=UPI0021800D12|nr:uncharacterized protein LOC126835382 [Adelges cooleyi]